MEKINKTKKVSSQKKKEVDNIMIMISMVEFLQSRERYLKQSGVPIVTVRMLVDELKEAIIKLALK